MNVDNVIKMGDSRRKKMRYLEEAMPWQKLAGKKVIDIGAAYGVWSVKAADAGADVVASNVTDEWIQKFHLYCRHYDMNIPCLDWDIQKYRNRKADVVFLFAVLHHVDDPGKVLDNVFRMAKEQIWIEISLENPNAEAGKYYPTADQIKDEITKRGGKIDYFAPARRGKYPRAIMIVSK